MTVLNTWISYTSFIFSSVADFLLSSPVVYFVVAFLVIFIFKVVKSFMR